ncbi:coadhesin-like [Elysia marginata]|uniref:Coadhesin-like n=1 Tax=Elysia marginata TaxID=1093978 RepID=A0AAV4FAU7_9GAST|nr:coadhesin-like [Elysia marginata]
MMETTGIKTIAIGIGKGADMDEVKSIASNPNLVFNVSSFQALENVTDALVTDICEVTRPPPPVTKPPPTVTPTIVIPSGTGCSVKEAMLNGEIHRVVINCNTKRILPEAICTVYRITDGGWPFPVTASTEYKHTKQGSTFRSYCRMTISLSELRAGNNTFMVYLYPNTTGGMRLVNATIPTKSVRLAFPQVTHRCPPSLLDDYLCGKPTRCDCKVVSQGRPRGRAAWYTGGITEHGDPLVITYDSRKPGVMYTCEGVSLLGRSFGSTLKIETETKCG